MKYIIVGRKSGPYGTDVRPTQEQVKEFGEGEYVLRRGDGSISKRFVVSLNRNGRLKLEAFDPEGIDGLSSLNLNRLIRDLARAVKLLPKSGISRGYRQIVDEVAARAALIATVIERADAELEELLDAEEETERPLAAVK